MAQHRVRGLHWQKESLADHSFGYYGLESSVPLKNPNIRDVSLPRFFLHLVLSLSSKALAAHTFLSVAGKQEAAHLAPIAKAGQRPGIADRFPQHNPAEAVARKGISVACDL